MRRSGGGEGRKAGGEGRRNEEEIYMKGQLMQEQS